VTGRTHLRRGHGQTLVASGSLPERRHSAAVRNAHAVRRAHGQRCGGTPTTRCCWLRNASAFRRAAGRLRLDRRGRGVRAEPQLGAHALVATVVSAATHPCLHSSTPSTVRAWTSLTCPDPGEACATETSRSGRPEAERRDRT